VRGVPARPPPSGGLGARRDREAADDQHGRDAHRDRHRQRRRLAPGADERRDDRGEQELQRTEQRRRGAGRLR
jgi:hypothetical protein